jgi:hypothetical protein
MSGMTNMTTMKKNKLNYVKIKAGTYRKNDIVDTVFPIIKPLNIGILALGWPDILPPHSV